MTRVSSGIGRYMRCLYAAMERLFAGEMRFYYFDGVTVSDRPPSPPANLERWSAAVDLLWRMPARLALAARLSAHALAERRFAKCARGMDLYHEAAYFPFRCPGGIKTVFTVHDMSLVRHPEYHPRERSLFFNLFFPGRFLLADAYLAVSDFTRGELLHFLDVDPDKVTTAPLAGDPEIFFPRSPAEIAAARKKWSLPERYFLFVGSGDPRKNLSVIPRAIKRAGLDAPLAVAGWRGWRKDKPEAIYLDFVPDDQLACLYSGALGLISPSSYEGFGLPALEAMHCGCPVVVARAASFPEVAGLAALYIDRPDCEEELAAAMRRLADDEGLRHGLRQSGLARAREFSWEKTARTTAEVYRRVFEACSNPVIC